MTTIKTSAGGLPRMIKRGEDQSLDITWWEEGSPILLTMSSALVTIKHGSRVIVDNQPATTVGGTTSATYLLTSATTAGLSLTDTMLEIWTLQGVVGGVPVEISARKSGHLVRTVLFPMIVDSDLFARHARLDDIRPPSLSDFSGYIATAWEVLNRDLLKKGRRPELVLDSYALVDAHLYKTLELVFRDAITFVGDGRYNDLAMMYAADYAREWDTIQFRYDRDEDDTLSDAEREAALPSVWLGEPPPGGAGGGSWGL